MSATAPQRGSNRNKDLKLFGGVVGVGIIIGITSVVLARSDTGQIDVAAAITSANIERAASGDTRAPTPVPKPAGIGDLPFGGLVGEGKPDRPKPQPEVEGEATSTIGNATSTDEGEAGTESETTEETVTNTVSEEE